MQTSAGAEVRFGSGFFERRSTHSFERQGAAAVQKVLVSACLLGRQVRYDGGHKQSTSSVLQRWLALGRVVAVCPEVAAGLTIPRPPAEISSGLGGAAVLSGNARVVGIAGEDFTQPFIDGARHALEQALVHGIRVAVLKEGSPSCGSHRIYDGTFSNSTVHGRGVTAHLLQTVGVHVFNEAQFEAADSLLQTLDCQPVDTGSGRSTG
jgi:uncharacterized protein YbbK (DUF523 family)